VIERKRCESGDGRKKSEGMTASRMPVGTIDNSPSPLFFVSDRNKGLEAVCFLSVLK
jgi:hypothetical protein